MPEAMTLAMEHYARITTRCCCSSRSRSARSSRPPPTCRNALAAVTTHDLPTLRGWWEEHDLALRDRLDLYPSEEFKSQAHATRASERRDCCSRWWRESLWHWHARSAAAAVFGGAGARRPCIPRPVAREHRDDPDRRPDRHDRSGQRARHRHRARELAAQGRAGHGGYLCARRRAGHSRGHECARRGVNPNGEEPVRRGSHAPQSSRRIHHRLQDRRSGAGRAVLECGARLAAEAGARRSRARCIGRC